MIGLAPDDASSAAAPPEFEPSERAREPGPKLDLETPSKGGEAMRSAWAVFVAPFRRMLDFVIEYNLVGSIASVTIGFVIATAVKSFVADVLMPATYKVFFFALYVTPLRGSEFMKRFFSVTELNADGFIKELVNLTLIMTCAYFLFIHVIERRLLERAARLKPPSASA